MPHESEVRDRRDRVLGRFSNSRYPQNSVAGRPIRIPVAAAAATASPYIASVGQQEAHNFDANTVFIRSLLFGASLPEVSEKSPLRKVRGLKFTSLIGTMNHDRPVTQIH